MFKLTFAIIRTHLCKLYGARQFKIVTNRPLEGARLRRSGTQTFTC